MSGSDNKGITSNGGSDNGNGFCFRCTTHVKGRKPCSLSHGRDGPDKGPEWVEVCPELEKTAPVR